MKTEQPQRWDILSWPLSGLFFFLYLCNRFSNDCHGESYSSALIMLLKGTITQSTKIIIRTGTLITASLKIKPFQLNKSLKLAQWCSQSPIRHFRTPPLQCHVLFSSLALFPFRGVDLHARGTLLTSVLKNLGSRWPILSRLLVIHSTWWDLQGALHILHSSLSLSTIKESE